MTILVTGAAGYIGSHTCLELLEQDYEVIGVDSLINSSRESLRRVESLTGKPLTLYIRDITAKDSLREIFTKHSIDAVLHFAALKAVGESVRSPLSYYRNNLDGLLTLCEIMAEHHVYNLIFSSSATVYGSPPAVPVREDFPLSAANPYGRTKLYAEAILTDLYQSDNQWSITLLRYFNPAGAHPSGCIGEAPGGIPGNLMPYITQAALGKRPFLQIFGQDYNTPDGTGIRDYIHITDLARGHIKALKVLHNQPGIHTYNLGTGRGYSVLEVIKAFERAAGRTIPYRFAPKRPGDIAVCYGDPALAKRELDWQAEKSLEQMCLDAFRWQAANPDGY